MSRTVVVTERERYTVSGIIRHLALQQPDHEMFVLGDERRTWAEQFDVSCRVANAAVSEGVGVGDRIAFLDRNGIGYFDFLFGGSLIGAVNVAVNWRLAASEMAAIIVDSQAPLLVIHTDFLSFLANMPGGLPHVRRIIVIGATEGSPSSDPRSVPLPSGSKG